jgi:pyruvate dehydrogenase E1 component alpha subunit
VSIRSAPGGPGGDFELRAPVGAGTPWSAVVGEPYSVIEQNGQASNGALRDLSDETLRQMYAEMVLVRGFDTRAMGMHRQGRIGFCVTATGEEAAILGSAWALDREDWVFTAYRELGVALHRGVPPSELYCQLFGNSGDLLKGRQMPNHYGSAAVRYTVCSSPVGTQIPQAVGAAYASRYRGERNATLVYFGDGATSTGDFHAAMTFAGVWRLPVIFFCRNNGWAISLPLERQTASATLAQKAHAYGFEGVRVDGNDLLAVYEVTRSALEKARAGGGPTMIEALTFRMGPHSSADDPTRYRSEEVCADWRTRDPIDRFRCFLTARGLWSDADEKRLREETEERLGAAIREAESLPPPDLDSLFEDVYAEVPWHLREQREELDGTQEGS